MASRPIQPVSRPVEGRLRPPGSRSLTNRALMVAALAKGTSKIEAVGFSDDTRIMAAALQTLGVSVEIDEAACRLRVGGCTGRVPDGPADLYTRDSGTATRFVTALVATGRGRYRVDGSERMRERPIQDLLDGLTALGVTARSEAGTGCPPVVVETQGLGGGTVSVGGAVSSQYLSALLMAAPAARSPLVLEVAGELVSKPFVDMTLSVMADFGLIVERDGYARFAVPAPQIYSGCRYAVEPDAASASYFLAAAAATGGRVTIEGLRHNSAQGDARFADVLGAMGCRVEWSADGVTVTGPEQLRGLCVDMNALPDMVLTLAPLALFAKGRTIIENVANLRVKESDRLTALATELTRLGARVEERPDGLIITPPDAVRPTEIATYRDHRMAMGMAVVGLRAAGITLADPTCVEKTYPAFFEDLEALTASGRRA